MTKATKQAKEAVEELGRAIDLLGEAAVKLILAEREECALTLESLAEGVIDGSVMKRTLLAGAEAIRDRRKP